MYKDTNSSNSRRTVSNKEFMLSKELRVDSGIYLDVAT